MQILLIPFLIILIPVVTLYLVLQHLGKRKKISLLLKIALGLIFMIVGIMMTFIAVLVSINGMGNAGVTCATGAVVFLPLGILVNVIGIPLMLISFRNKFPFAGNLTG